MGEQTKKEIVLEIEIEDVRVMIGILMQFHFDHPSNHKIAAIIDQM